MYIGKEEAEDRKLQEEYARNNPSKRVEEFAATAWDSRDKRKDDMRKEQMGTHDRIVALPGGGSYRIVEGARRGTLIRK